MKASERDSPLGQGLVSSRACSTTVQRSDEKQPFTPNRTVLWGGWIPPRPTFPLNLPSQAHANRGPKEGKSGGLYTPSSMRVKGLRVLLAPRKSSSIHTPPAAKPPALSPAAGPSLVITMVLQEGCARAARGTVGRSVFWRWAEAGSPLPGKEEPAPQRGPVPAFDLSEPD
jgi:hypothetical protein